jgi:hypothetical protein
MTALAACGRSPLALDNAPHACDLGVVAVPDLAVAAPDLRGDLASPDLAAVPEKPCHLVLTGAPVETVSFSQYSFYQEGLMARTPAPGRSAHVVQSGSVPGAGTDGWHDPAFYAAEYDVSVWPPVEVQAPVRISDWEEGSGPVAELPGGELFFTWYEQVDAGGLGSPDIQFRTVNGSTWQMGALGTLVKDAFRMASPPVPNGAGGLFAAYVHTQEPGDPLVVTGLDGQLGSFDATGAPSGGALQLWNATGSVQTNAPLSLAWYENLPNQSLTFTKSGALVVAAFAGCGDSLASAYCEPQSMVLLQPSPSEDGGVGLQKVASLPNRSSDNTVQQPTLISDGEGHNWLIWWEGPLNTPDLGPYVPYQYQYQYLYALPLTDSGAPAGPVENWAVGDRERQAFPGPAPTVGRLGVISTVGESPAVDGGFGNSQWHLIHRQLDGVAPLEDVVIPMDPFANIQVVQTREPRAVIVGYTASPPTTDAGSGNSYGMLMRFTCAEDAD